MKQQLTNLELSIFAEQLALILHSGISVLEGISILQEDLSEKAGGRLLGSIYDSMEQSGDFSQSLADTGFFPEYFVQMTKLGERSGMLEDVLTSLADYYRRQDTLLHHIRDALIYPLVLLGMLTAVLAVLIHQVMPVFADVFQQLGLNMSGMAQTVFSLSNLLQRFSAVFLFLLIAAVLAALYAVRSVRFRTSLFALLCRFPFLRTIMLQTARARFAHALSLSLHSGLDPEESFALASMLTHDQLPAEQLSLAQELLMQGRDCGEALKESGIFSGLDASLISIGFRTGSAEDALTRISQSSQQAAEETLQNIIGAIEPTLTAFLSILTGIILVSVMLPLLNLMASIG